VAADALGGDLSDGHADGHSDDEYTEQSEESD
jgi:hypothetical protein